MSKEKHTESPKGEGRVPYSMVVVLIPVFWCLNLLLVKIEGSDLGCGTWFLLPTISW